METTLNITVTLTSKLRLEQALKKEDVKDPATVKELTINGKLTENDCEYIHKNMGDSVQKIDMGNVSFTKNKIPKFAFDNCICLTTVILPNSVVKIGDWAFSGCRNLNSIIIPDSVVEIGDFAFEHCSFITVHPDNPVFWSKEGNLLMKAEPCSGKAGELDWSFSDGVLTISGEGEIPDYDDSSKDKYVGTVSDEGRSPWYSIRKGVMSVVFKGTISEKSGDAFAFPYLRSVTFEDCHVRYHEDYMGMHCIIDRALQGYTTQDLWNIDYWFSGQIARMLQEFKKKAMGFPGNMTKEEWYEILDRMIFCFSEIYTHSFSFDKEKCAHSEKMQKEGFELFVKHFRQLWW